MPLAVTHTIPTMELFNYLKNKYKLQKYVGPRVLFIVAASSLLPDTDIALNWILKFFGFTLKHGTYTHTLAFGFLFLLPGILMFLFKRYKYALYLFIAFAGIFVHLFMDYFLGGGAQEGVMWFYPLSNESYKLHLLFLIPLKNLPESLDALVLLAWIYAKSPILSRRAILAKKA